MKRNVMGLFLVLSAVAALLPGRLPGQTPTGRALIYSLLPGEEIMTAESVIALSADLDDVLLVLTQGPKGPFSVFRDGKKSKAFADLKEAMKAAYEGRKGSSDKQRNCASYKPGPAPVDALPSAADNPGGGQVVRFKDKTFGPYLLIYSSRATPDGARAYYTANDKESAVFGCTDGRKLAVGGLPGDYKFSPSGLNAAVLCQGTLNFLDQKKLASLPLQQVAADMEKKFIHTIDGKKFGPFGSSFNESDYWFAATGNDLYYEVGDQLFRNGIVLLKTPWVDPCSFYPSADGKTYAMYDYQHIAFSDGQKFPSPLDITVFVRNGQTIFKWVTLENKKDLVVYQRAM